MAKKKTSPSRAPPRTPQEKLRGLVDLRAGPVPVYTQKQLAEILGVSTRTLRRFRNQPGWKLSPRTVEKIAKPLAREDAALGRMVKAGTAFEVVVTKSKGKTKRTFKRVKGVPSPKTRVLQLPTAYPAREGDSRTLQYYVEGWATEQKVELLEAAQHDSRYTSWHAKIMVPPGVSISGRKGQGKLADEEEIDEETGEEVEAKPQFYMIGPFAFRGNLSKIAEEIHYHEDAGRVVIEINIVEKLRRRKSKK